MLMPTLMTFRLINTSAWLNPPSYWNRWRTASPGHLSWMASNRLRLNPTKTEVIWLGFTRRLAQCPADPLLLLGASIQPVCYVSDLGVIGQDLSLASHMSHVTSVCFFHLRQLCLVRHSLTTDTAHALVRAKFTITWTTAMECLQVCQWVCSTVSSLYLGPLCDSSSAYQAVHQSCEQSVICFIGLVILSV